MKLKNKILLTILAIAAMLFILSTISYGAKYENESFSVNIPDNYTVEFEGNRLIAERDRDTALAIENSDYDEYIYADLGQDYLEYMVDYLKDIYGSEITILSQNLVTKSACPGIEIEYKLVPTGDLYYAELYQIQSDHYVYTLDFMARDRSYLSSSEKNAILNSFKTKDTVAIENGVPFIDVPRGEWYYEPVQFCVNNEIINGTSINTFEPDTNISRGMLVTILWRMEGAPILKTGKDFSDVSSSVWYYNAIKWAASNEIINGYGNGKFGPDDSVTREQLAVIMRNYSKYSGLSTNNTANLSKYSDRNKISSWANSAVQWAVATGVISGKTSTTIAPSDTATRAEATTMIWRYIMNNSVG